MINNTAGYILLLALTIVLYDVVTHLDEEIDYIVRSRFTSVKTIFILCRYLPFVIGALRMYDVVGEDYIDANLCLVLCRTSIWISFLQMACVEFLFILRAYALWGCSKRVLFYLLAAYLTTCVIGISSLQIYTGALPADACYGPANPGASWLLTSFAALISLEIGLFGMSIAEQYRVFRSQRGSEHPQYCWDLAHSDCDMAYWHHGNSTDSLPGVACNTHATRSLES
ncbi:uncharacterized protein F5891DRAFT_124570 [Suillus fuscotomentosus]|uniref:DUF6533 domain-containing protein n=1 Tax=Suillus fuscotomentosus TaxID=1912939 RepID=A0AAD4DQY6_9AGAM|nr:uncharacterized protein F5891DRAFT_124570 [Suillus fuscotomentosus]KAG1890504.1 hypothetical protein F5891DRAFT_124570 [Suillus fuscotomentosus]